MTIDTHSAQRTYIYPLGTPINLPLLWSRFLRCSLSKIYFGYLQT